MSELLNTYLIKRNTTPIPELAEATLTSLTSGSSNHLHRSTLPSHRLIQSLSTFFKDLSTIYSDPERFSADHFSIIVAKLVQLRKIMPAPTFRHIRDSFQATNTHFAHTAANHCDSLNLKQIVLITECLSRLDCRHQRYLFRVAEQISKVELRKEMSLDDAVSLLNSFARIHMDLPKSFFTQLIAKISEEKSQATPNQISKTVWSLATLAFSDQAELVRDLTVEAIKKCDSFDQPRDGARLSWALCYFDNNLVAEVLSVIKIDRMKLNDSDKNQLNTAYRIIGEPAPFKELLSHPAQKRDFRPTFFEDQVYQILIETGMPTNQIYQGKFVAGIHTDIIVLSRSMNWALMCAGKKGHLTSSGRRLGRDCIQDKLFLAAGYLPVHLNQLISPDVPDAKALIKSQVREALKDAQTRYRGLVANVKSEFSDTPFG